MNCPLAHTETASPYGWGRSSFPEAISFEAWAAVVGVRSTVMDSV